jgi:hypothetical protein
MNAILLDMNCDRGYDTMSRRKNKLALMTEWDLSGYVFSFFDRDFPSLSKKDMISMAYFASFPQ